MSKKGGVNSLMIRKTINHDLESINHVVEEHMETCCLAFKVIQFQVLPLLKCRCSLLSYYNFQVMELSNMIFFSSFFVSVLSIILRYCF